LLEPQTPKINPNTFLKFRPKHNPYSPTFTLTSKEAISQRNLLKVRDKLEVFDLKMQEINLKMLQYKFDLLFFWFETKKEAKQPLVSPEVYQSHDGNGVANAREEKKEACVEDVQEEEEIEFDLDLHPKFDEHEDD